MSTSPLVSERLHWELHTEIARTISQLEDKFDLHVERLQKSIECLQQEVESLLAKVLLFQQS